MNSTNPPAHKFVVRATEDGYCGKFMAWPEKKGEWRFLQVHLWKLPDGTIQGSTLNDYCDGNWRGLEHAVATHYYTEWSKTCLEKETPHK